MEIMRFTGRVVATPIFAIAFGFFWLMFIAIGSVFATLAFLERKHFNWKDHLKGCNEFFLDPFRRIWRGKNVG